MTETATDHPHRTTAFTMLELMIAMGGSIIILGSLLAASIGLQKSFSASERYAETQIEERRLIDYIGRDLRRAVGVSKRDVGLLAEPYAGGDFDLVEGAELILTLPAYYRSNAPADSGFDQALPVIGTSTGRVDYGTVAGPAPPFLVIYRKVFYQPEGSICFVRDEEGTRELVVRDAAGLTLRLSAPTSRANIRLSAAFRASFSRRGGAVNVYDEVMLRNQRIDQ